MKIAWFTPFRKASAIGRFSAIVTERLAQEAAVHMWVADPETEEFHETRLPIFHYPRIPNADRLLREYDMVVYNLGDHAGYHGPIFRMSQQVPGIIILHDYVMHHCIATYYAEHRAWDQYAEALRKWYGLDLHWTGSSWTGRDQHIAGTRDNDGVIHYPLFEEAVIRSRGVITHAEFVREAVSRIAGSPVARIPLAYTTDRRLPSLSRKELGVPDGRTLVVTIGHTNENKRIHVILKMLADNPDLAKSITYVIVGNHDGPFGPRLLSISKELGLEERVRFTGSVSDEVLHSFLAHADFCLNLRWPAMEGGSASCAEQMLLGKASIVTDAGVYRELPDDCVRKIRPEHEAADLVRAVRELAADPALRESLGERARQYAEANFTPENYTRRLLEFFSTVEACGPAIELIDRTAQEMRRMGVSSDMAIVDTVSRESALLMDGDYDPPILRAN